MAIGRTISIYLPDSNPQSIKICDFLDSIVEAIYIPRAKLDDISNISELNQPGVYFLIGEKDELGKPSVYIGESEVLSTRLNEHNKTKDFWNLAICFVSEKNILNKAHIKYLENHACEQAKLVNKCILENNNTPAKPQLINQEEENGIYVFQENFTFSSPSTAASVVLGRSANGWIEWKDKNGKTLDEVIRNKEKEG